MDIGFVWDEKKYPAVVKAHNVKFYEDEYYQRQRRDI
jgi:hypothetical protein